MKLITTLTSMAAFSLLTATSQATAFWTFTQEGNDVRAKLSGSFESDIPRMRNFPTEIFPSSFSTTAQGNRVINVRAGVSFNQLPGVAGTSLFSSSTGNAQYISGPSFATDLEFLRVDTSLLDNGVLKAATQLSGEMLFENHTIDMFNLTPGVEVTLWRKTSTSTRGDSLVIVGVVPEPSSTALAGIGVLFFVARRKR